MSDALPYESKAQASSPLAKRICPKCGGGMTVGFRIDVTYGTTLQESWYPGSPEKSFWTGVKVRRNQKIPVTTYRCDACGFLESYATRA